MICLGIICYNYAHFLGEAIESALSQTYKPIEITVINDGSTDNTIEVATRYPVKLVNQVNQGVVKTMNRFMREISTSEYCIMLSADDKFDTHYVEKTLKVLLENPNIAFVYTYIILFGEINNIIKPANYSLASIKSGSFTTGSILMKRSAFLQTGGFDPNLTSLEDKDLWLSFYKKGFYGKLLPEPLLFYRQHTKNTSQWLARRTLNYRKILKKHASLYTRLERELLDKKAIYASMKEKLLPRGTCRRENFDWFAKQIKKLP